MLIIFLKLFHTFSFFYIKNCLFLYFLSFTFGAVTIFDQAFVKSIKSRQGEHVFVASFLKGKNFVRKGMW